MANDNSEVEYEKEEGFVRLNLRRPVNLYVPSDQQEEYDPTAESEEASATLQLDWAYGYRGKDCRNNMFLLGSGEIIYFTAAVVVIYEPGASSQRHFIHHTDDIKCLTVHSDGKTVATGQVKGKEGILPHVCVWDSENLEVLHTFGEETFTSGVSCIAFSKDGDLLAAVDDSQEPSLTLWRWKEGEKIVEAKASSELVIGVTFTGESPSRIVTSGRNHLAFWTYEDSGTLDKDMAIFGDLGKPKYVTSVAVLPSGNIMTGDTAGHVLIWESGENKIERVLETSHKGAIFYLALNEDGTLISSGSDNKMIMYDADFAPTGEVIEIPEHFGSGRIVLKIDDVLYIGTTFNGFIKATMDSEFEVLTQGHLDEVWALATEPNGPHFLVSGHDGKIYYRNSESNELVWQKEVEMECQSAGMSPCGTVSVVGADQGRWIVINNTDQEILLEETSGDEPIQVTRFSPDGSKLALGSRDNYVYIYDVDIDEKSFTQSGKCEGHSSFVTHLDWSEDGQMLRTNSGDYEVLFWKTDDCSRLTNSDEFKDIVWATNNCILSFETVGIWPPGVDGTHINSCNKANEKPLLASGDDFGVLKLFKFPATVQNAKHTGYIGHCSHITNVKFLQGDEFLVSTGGRDQSVLKWKVVE